VILRQANNPIDENEADIDLGIDPKEVGEDLNQMKASEIDRRSDNQLAGGRRIFAGGGTLSFHKIGQDAL